MEMNKQEYEELWNYINAVIISDENGKSALLNKLNEMVD